MIFINHRINTVDQLKTVPHENGIEIDVRYHENDLVLHHDPFSHHQSKPQNLEDLLKKWKHEGPMILNVKTEGVEEKCIQLMNQYQIKNWFFLDLSMPYFVKYAKLAKEKSLKGFQADNLAVRFSEAEPIEYALSFKDQASWVWVDCFTHLPLNKDNYKQLQDAGFKICLVSPELQGHPLEWIAQFKKQLATMPVDAVCTKRPELWQKDV